MQLYYLYVYWPIKMMRKKAFMLISNIYRVFIACLVIWLRKRCKVWAPGQKCLHSRICNLAIGIYNGHCSYNSILLSIL